MSGPRPVLRAVALLLAVTLGLVGCATPQPSGPIPATDVRAAWLRHDAWLSSLAQWRAVGRVALRMPQDSWSAGLQWQQSGDAFRIRLSGPLGQGGVRIDGDPRGVTLESADGAVHSASSAEALLARELGWQVPVSVLRFWMLGRPAPAMAVDAFELDVAGRLHRLEQAGWQVRVASYREVDGGVLPARLEVSRPELHARIVLTRWQLSS